MNQKALKTLEYNKILELLEGFATSSLGKQLCRDLKPLDNIVEIEAMQQETADALSRVYQKGALSFSGVKDIRGSLKRLEIPTVPKLIPEEKTRRTLPIPLTVCLKFYSLLLLFLWRSAAVFSQKRKSQMMPVRLCVRSAGL